MIDQEEVLMERAGVSLYVLRIISLSLSLAMLSGPVSAEVYKWTDENGQVHYDEHPPESGAEVKRMTIDHAPPSATNARERLEQYQKELDATTEEGEKREKEQAAAQNKREIQQKNCETAKARLNRYSAPGRVYQKGESGEREYLDEQQRADKRKQAQELVDKWCR